MTSTINSDYGSNVLTATLGCYSMKLFVNVMHLADKIFVSNYN